MELKCKRRFALQLSSYILCKIQKDSERLAIEKVYKYIVDQVTSANGELQVIVIDHAEIEEPWFKNRIKESWWDDDTALIPKEWIY